MSDLIDRKAIIGFANELEQRTLKLSNNDSKDILYKTVRATIKAICKYCEKLPSVQPEPAIPLKWIEAQIEWLKSLDNAFSTLMAVQISEMVNKWKGEQDG